MSPKDPCHRTQRRKERIKSVLARRQPDLRLVLANIHDPHNVSAILRSCDAFGVGEVDLYYTDTPFPNLGKKSSASAKKWVSTQRFESAGGLVDSLRQKGCQLLCTGFTSLAKPVTDWDMTGPTAVFLGNEHRGVAPELEESADGLLYIPMQGMIQSLNVSVAAAVILYEAYRQRKVLGLYDTPRLTPEQRENMEIQWCCR